MKLRKLITNAMTVVMTTTVILSPTAITAKAEQSGGLNVQTHTTDEIKEFINEHNASVSEPISYSKEPVLTAPYDPGSLSEETQMSALNMLNQVRYIAGLDADVTLDSEYIEKVQAGTLINAVNGKLSHTPTQPEGMSKELYDLGYSGMSSANIGFNHKTLNSAILEGWMYDGDDSNIPKMGHRRWILNPSMAKTGFGEVNAYSAVYAFDRSRTSSYTNVAWPAQTMPIEYFGNTYPWTLSTGETEDIANVAITLTRKSDNRTWNFSSASADGDFYVDNGGYGQKGCIIFRPTSVEKYSPDDVFEVTITGLVQGTVNYQVQFFSLSGNDNPSIYVQTKPQTESGKYTIRVLAEISLNGAFVGNMNNSYIGAGFRCSKQKSNVASAEAYLSTVVFGSVQANGKTIQAADGKYFVVTEITDIGAEDIVYVRPSYKVSENEAGDFCDETYTINMIDILAQQSK